MLRTTLRNVARNMININRKTLSAYKRQHQSVSHPQVADMLPLTIPDNCLHCQAPTETETANRQKISHKIYRPPYPNYAPI